MKIFPIALYLSLYFSIIVHLAAAAMTAAAALNTLSILIIVMWKPTPGKIMHTKQQIRAKGMLRIIEIGTTNLNVVACRLLSLVAYYPVRHYRPTPSNG